MRKKKYLEIEEEIESFGFTIVDKDLSRPWGAFFVIEENQAQDFSNRFFDGIDLNSLRIQGKLSPKILIIKPGSRLSWQYHNRRAEIWQIYHGKVGIIRSNDDEEGELRRFNKGDQIKIAQRERHRIVGLEEYAILAEIWQHTDVVPSNEDDIIRIQDDFKRI